MVDRSHQIQTHDQTFLSQFFSRFVLFEWWSKLSNRVNGLSRKHKILLFTFVLVVGIAGRLWAQTKPSNFDFNVWLTASQSLLDGNNPYALAQFNYGPTWLGIITGIRYTAPDTEVFRLLIAIFLAAVDVGIAVVLIKKGYALAAVVFFLSPISIAISGQHQQIDNLSILVTLIAIVIAARSNPTRITNADWIAVLLLGLSLSIKHVFLLLPVWLALRSGTIMKRVLYLTVPYLVFGLSLLIPFLSAPETVTQTMIQYGGANNSPVLYFLLPDQMMAWVISWDGTKVFFAIALIVSGFIFRKIRLFEFTLIYTITAVVFSWAIVNQYLAVPVAAMAIWMNLAFLIWIVQSTIFLWGDPTTLNVPILNAIQPHTFLEFDVVAKDLFIWIFAGWLILVFTRNKLPQE